MILSKTYRVPPGDEPLGEAWSHPPDEAKVEGRPKPRRKSRECPGIIGKPSENNRKTIGKPWENHRKTIGKPQENHRKTLDPLVQ